MTFVSAEGEFDFLTCGECGIRFAAPTVFIRARRDGDQGVRDFYCPNGHIRVFRESEIDKVRRERDQLQQQAARLEEERAAADRRADAERRKRERVEKRAGAGVCPCCNRTVAQLARHMQSKHPDAPFVKAAAPPKRKRMSADTPRIPAIRQKGDG